MKIFKLKHIEKVDFLLLKRPTTPNSFLACPKDFYSLTSDKETPIFKYTLNDAIYAWDQIISQLERTNEIIKLARNNQKTYVQRSLIMGYPDIITVQFEKISIETTGITLYSRSQYGYSDLGVNKKRVTELLSKFLELLAY